MKNYKKQIEFLYKNILNLDIKSIQDDYKNGYLTINQGRDKNIYIYYFDGVQDVAINVATLEQLSQEDIEKILL